MKLRSILALTVGLSLLVPVSRAFAAGNVVPVVNTFDLPATSSSPIPVLAFTASDSNGTVVGYMITDSATKPAATDARWTATAWTQYVTTKFGTLTLYAWAKDNAAAVSSSKNDTVAIPDPTQARLAALEAQVAALQNLLAHFSRSGDDITVAGANMHIVSGAGSTDGPVNGLGNLIVGYNEVRGDEEAVNNRTGSHNIIVGKEHNFSSFGGLVIGRANEISGEFAVLSGGYFNIASGPYSSVAGGVANVASGDSSFVGGGSFNSASGMRASVVGGTFNVAIGTSGAAFGGYNNKATGDNSAVMGGQANETIGGMSSISGGEFNHATGNYSSVAGGYNNTAGGDFSSVSGGNLNSAIGWGSTVSGGSERSSLGLLDWVAGSLFEDQ